MFSPGPVWFNDNETLLDYSQIPTPPHAKIDWGPRGIAMPPTGPGLRTLGLGGTPPRYHFGYFTSFSPLSSRAVLAVSLLFAVVLYLVYCCAAALVP